MRSAMGSRGLVPLFCVLSLTGSTLWYRSAAADPSPRDVVRTLERNAQRLGRTSLAGERFEAIRGRSTTIALRPGRGVISVERPFSRRGYFLGANGRLSPADRTALGKAIARANPKATSRQVLGSLRASLGKHRARQRTLRQADPTIAGLLSKIAALPANERRDEIPLGRSQGASLSYRPATKVIVGSAGLGSQGFFFQQTRLAGTPVLRDDSRQALRAFITDHPTAAH